MSPTTNHEETDHALRSHYAYRVAQTLVFLAVTTIGQTSAPPQDKIISHLENVPRMVRAWNSIRPATVEYNAAMTKANALLQSRFDPKVVTADPDAARHTSVANYKAAKEALLKQVDALNELIEEEDY